MTLDAWVEDKPPETCRLVTPLRVNPVKAPACDAASGPLPGPRVSLPPAQFEFMIESVLYAEGGRGHLADHGRSAPRALQR